MLSDRIKQARQRIALSQQQVADKMGVSKTAVFKWENGNYEPKNLDILANILGVSLTWLREGRGNPFPAQPDDIPAAIDSGPYNQDEVAVCLYPSIELAGCVRSKQAHKQHCKKFSLSTELLERKKINAEMVVCFPVSDNSMEPIFPHGTIFAVDLNRTSIIDGNLYLIKQNHRYRVRKLYSMPNEEVRLHAYNTAEYQDECAPVKQIIIIGRVFYYAVEL
ncbi:MULTISPECIES: S24 family peptidase [Snodgrassella]|uniref:S24 family peptidase n=1 Tax=Snodgrassella TaxID=1193515 RepID=UPI00226A2CF5|nr:S24 family peptidase [Snodgrassella sp. B3837]MCT6881019.1 helix-turn-helix domain-containing protein [Snodgrassella alvi]MCX8753275.1 helix-turn-helix domain-containing protein [Snodgrassella sp. B3837]